jgi:hypothetical protein
MHGSVRAGPAPDGGFRLEAVLPAYVPTAEPAEPAGRAQPAGRPEPAGRAGQPEPAARPA